MEQKKWSDIGASSSTDNQNAKALQQARNEALEDAKCIICSGTHPLHKCSTFKLSVPFDVKWNEVRMHKRCQRCLFPNHSGPCTNPQNNDPCPSCKTVVYHNSLLCATKAKIQSDRHAITHHTERGRQLIATFDKETQLALKAKKSDENWDDEC